MHCDVTASLLQNVLVLATACARVEKSITANLDPPLCPIFIQAFFNSRCKIVQFLTYLTALVSIYTLVLMSVDRFLAVVYPIESMTMRTEANCRIAITTTWIICFIVCCPLIGSHGEIVPPNTSLSYCIFLDNDSIPFLPDTWDARWSQSIFSVSVCLRPPIAGRGYEGSSFSRRHRRSSVSF